MEREFRNKNEDSVEMKDVGDWALERMANLVKDAKTPEEAETIIGRDNYEKVRKFLEKEKKEEYTRKLQEEEDEKKEREEKRKAEEERTAALEEDRKERNANYYKREIKK